MTPTEDVARPGGLFDDVRVLPASADEAVVHLRAEAANLAEAERARRGAVAAVREAVMAARVMRVPWQVIGEALGVSRQAAAERFGGEVRAQLVLAWHSIEVRLAEVAATRKFRGRPMDLLEELARQGAVPVPLVSRARDLLNARSSAVHGANAIPTAADAEHLTSVAIPLAGVLWLLQHPEEALDEYRTP